MKTTKITIALSLICLFLHGCSKSAPIKYADVCNPENKDKQITVEGYIAAGKPVPCSFFGLRPRRCSFMFLSKPDSDDKGFLVHIPEGAGGSNQVETPDSINDPSKISGSLFKQADVKLHAKNGSIVTPKDKIKITGKVGFTSDSTSDTPLCSVMVYGVEK